jgi:hypothetical protein
MKKLILVISSLIATVSMSSEAGVPSTSPYVTDYQASYIQDSTYQVFSFASTVACFISSTAPEKMAGKGQYLAQIDTRQCNHTSTPSSGSASSTSGPHYVNALVTSTIDATTTNLQVQVLLDITPDPSINGDTESYVQAKVTIISPPSAKPPYGEWNMDSCSRSVSTPSGTCTQIGFIRASQSGLSVLKYQNSSNNSSGTSVYTSNSTANGRTGYGAISLTNNNNGPVATTAGTFSFVDGAYLLSTAVNNGSPLSTCTSPKQATAAMIADWQDNLYDQTNGEVISAGNQGYNLLDPTTLEQVGFASYYGVNIWNNAPSADALNGASLLAAVNGTNTPAVLHITPGTLQKQFTQQSSMTALDGIIVNMGLGGPGIDTSWILTNLLGVTITQGSSYTLIGSWAAESGSHTVAQVFTITGYQECTSGGSCTNTYVSQRAIDFDTLYSDGFSYFYTYNNTGSSFNGGFDSWNGSAQVEINSPVLTSQTSINLSPYTSGIPSKFFCVGYCPKLNGSNVIAASLNANEVVYYFWHDNLGAPTIGTSSTQDSGIKVDFTTTGTPYNFQFYDATTNAALNAMVCGSNYCQWQYSQNANAVTYTWSSGASYNSYNYITLGSQTTSPTFTQPLNLSYTVANSPPIGTASSYAGQTIAIQSAGPGQLWLPGHCVNNLLAPVDCSSAGSNWVNDVIIPTEQDSYGSVKLLNSAGAPTSTSYYVKWLQRGVYPTNNPSLCTGLSLPSPAPTLPSQSDWDSTVKSLGWPSASSFTIAPSVIGGIIQ